MMKIRINFTDGTYADGTICGDGKDVKAAFGPAPDVAWSFIFEFHDGRTIVCDRDKIQNVVLQGATE